MSCAFYLPTEHPPRTIDIKRALLTYEQVVLPSPDDRELIPPELFLSAISPIPFPVFFNAGPVLPLGKTNGFDDQLAELLDQCRGAIRQGTLSVLGSPTYRSDQLTIGGLPEYDDHILKNPILCFRLFRAIAATYEFSYTIGKHLDVRNLVRSNDPDMLSPTGSGHGQINTIPPLGDFSIAGMAGEEHQAAMRLHRARLAHLIKWLMISEDEGYEPFSGDSGVDSTISLLKSNVLAWANQLASDEKEAKQEELLRRVDVLMFHEYVDQQKLARMSVQDVLKYRSKAWGKAQQARRRFVRAIVDVARSEPRQEKFEACIKAEIDKYLREYQDWQSEASKVGSRLFFRYGAWSMGAAAVGSSALITGVLSNFGVEILLGIGGMVFKELEQRSPEVIELFRTRKSVEEMPGYAIHQMYKL